MPHSKENLLLLKVEFSVKPSITWTQANYNALVLYNYIAQILHECILEDDSEDILLDVAEKIKKFYKNENIKVIDQSIDKAVSDIRAYFKALIKTEQNLTALIEKFKNKELDEKIRYFQLSDIDDVPIEFNVKLESLVSCSDNIFPTIGVELFGKDLMKNVMCTFKRQSSFCVYCSKLSSGYGKVCDMSEGKDDISPDEANKIINIHDEMVEYCNHLREIVDDLINSIYTLYCKLIDKKQLDNDEVSIVYDSVYYILYRDYGVSIYYGDNDDTQYSILDSFIYANPEMSSDDVSQINQQLDDLFDELMNDCIKHAKKSIVAVEHIIKTRIDNNFVGVNWDDN